MGVAKSSQEAPTTTRTNPPASPRIGANCLHPHQHPGLLSAVTAAIMYIFLRRMTKLEGFQFHCDAFSLPWR